LKNFTKNIKAVLIICLPAVIIFTIIIRYIAYYHMPSSSLKWTQEYIAGQGNIKGNVNLYLFGTNPAYEIGANEDGYAVFKNPGKAFTQMKNDYSNAIRIIKKQFKLSNINNLNFKIYKNYGAQVIDVDKETRDNAFKISQFCDIYENSFR